MTDASPAPRVLVLVENLSVPMDRRVWQECRALVAAGLEVEVICPRGQHADRDRFEERDGVRIHRYRLHSARGGLTTYLLEYPVAVLATMWLALRLARRRPFDVVQACNPPDLLFLVALVLRARHGTRFVFDHHDLVPELYQSRFDRPSGDLVHRILLLLERWTFRSADTVLSTNESYRGVALERGGKEPDRVHVVRSAPDLRRFRPCPPDPALRRGRPHLACYLGVMGPQDGVDHALRALAAYRDELGRDDLFTVLIGAGDAFEACLELRDELRLGDVTHFTGRVPDDEVIRHLSTADVCLAPDPRNPLNDVSTMNKIMEYMAMGRPIVSYDLVESRVSAGAAAAYAEPNDPAHLARLLGELLDDPDRRASMGKVGMARVGGPLSWETSERNLLRAYDATLPAGLPERDVLSPLPMSPAAQGVHG